MYEEIIAEIKANLGENKDLNKKYLSSQIDRYKDHPYNKEIIREISRMMWDCLSDEEKEEFIEISEKENPVMDILNEIHKRTIRQNLIKRNRKLTVIRIL